MRSVRIALEVAAPSVAEESACLGCAGGGELHPIRRERMEIEPMITCSAKKRVGSSGRRRANA